MNESSDRSEWRSEKSWRATFKLIARARSLHNFFFSLSTSKDYAKPYQ